MKELARRAFLRFIPVVAAAGPMAAKAAVNGAMSQQVAGALGQALNGAPSALQAPNMPPEIQALYDLTAKRREQAQQIIAYRDGHFDADIAALRSLPHATKVRMQLARDDAFKAANRTIWDKISEWQGRFQTRQAGQMIGHQRIL